MTKECVLPKRIADVLKEWMEKENINGDIIHCIMEGPSNKENEIEDLYHLVISSSHKKSIDIYFIDICENLTGLSLKQQSKKTLECLKK